MVINLRTGAAMADKERLCRQIGPGDSGAIGERMTIRQRGHERFGPYPPGMAVGQLRRAYHERNVQPAAAKLHDRVARCALSDLDLYTRIVLSILPDQFCKEAPWDQGMDADSQAAAVTMRRHAGSLHRMIELVDACGDTFHEMPASVRQPNSSRVTLKQEDAQIVLQSLHSGADT